MSITLQFIQLGISFGILVVLVFAAWKFWEWRDDTKKKSQAVVEMTSSVRQMTVRVEEFLMMSKGWAKVGQEHENQARITAEEAKKQAELAQQVLTQSTTELNKEIQKVPKATAAEVVAALPGSGTFIKPAPEG